MLYVCTYVCVQPIFIYLVSRISVSVSISLYPYPYYHALESALKAAGARGGASM